MILMTCNNIVHSINSTPLLNNISLSLHDTDKTALVGNNGCGKSTLIRLFADKQSVDSGEITWRRNTRLGIIEQFVSDDMLELTVLSAIKQNASSNIQESDWELSLLLNKLGFEEDSFGTKVTALSGGWKNRLLLARALAAEPDFLLLDEPTNHMDVATLLFFEDFLRELSIPYLLISHDREFLDTCTNRTLFLRDGKIFDFPFAYSQARQALYELDEADKARRKSELKEIDRITASAKQLATWGKIYSNEKFSRRAESMFKRIEKMRGNITEIASIDKRKLTIETSETRAKYAVTFENTIINILNNKMLKTLFTIEKLSIARGDRVVILGKNGCGKSVFLKKLAEQYNSNHSNADIRFNPQCTLGYYDQMLGGISQSLSIFNILRDISTGSDLSVKQNLITAGFPIEEHHKTSLELSGGQRARLQMLLISTIKPNILILDEPTNHIDIAGCEALESELLSSKITVFFSSHDRRFITNIANRFILVHKGKLLEINNPDEYYAMELEEEEIHNVNKNNTKSESIHINADSEDNILQTLIAIDLKITAELRQKAGRQNLKLLNELKTKKVELEKLL
ncbi:ABC-F family ATP-binding cassette domain-containing protein [Fluviispira multicolorata]|uniref:ATP-binding cassette domain-containing protein n=1 Tax=Fluviispira multicolorata TaxID=2654512 RepID=A0A833JBD1_9BACT|nr:ATP-binding cassette domain-containing protein [Fluviispira multicolorata]KAB8028494.1 ATP-binding cassette domain-containing protein [Fluviispira multicolorata]